MVWILRASILGMDDIVPYCTVLVYWYIGILAFWYAVEVGAKGYKDGYSPFTLGNIAGLRVDVK
jgi:hypothetical protein